MALGIVPRLQQLVLSRYHFSEKTRAFLLHDAGPFTIFFWCPFVKWCIVFANISDLRVPVQNISTNQQLAVAMTGVIWARYSTQIYPFNLNLLLVNAFMGVTGLYQLARKLHHNTMKKTD